MSTLFRLSSVAAIRLGLLFALLLPASTVSAAIYNVGPGQTYTRLGAVPWSTLLPGDEVRVHWKSEPYREKILITCKGTASQRIRILGLPGPNGERPVIDGQNATTDRQFEFLDRSAEDSGVVTFWRRRDQHYEFKSGYIDFEGFEVRNGYRGSDTAPNTYTAFDGTTRSYEWGANGIYVLQGEHINFRNNAIHSNGNGLFIQGRDNNDFLVEFNRIYNNSAVARDRQHNVYTECRGIVFQYNFFGRTRAGSEGGNLKDRSAGTVIRYNWIEGGARHIDLVEAQESWETTTADPRYRESWVYGNIILNEPGDAGRLVHYGHDSSELTSRRGTLYFYNNTVIVRRSESEAWMVRIFDVSTNDERVDARNNIFYAMPATAGAVPTQLCWMQTYGRLDLGLNYVSPNWRDYTYDDRQWGTITGSANLVTSATNNVGMVNAAQNDFTLLANSICAKRGWPLHANAIAAYNLTRQYVLHMQGRDRIVNTVQGGMDLGAFESGGSVVTPTLASLSPSSASAGSAAFTLTVNGSGFVSGATVRWNGLNRTTTFVSAAQLTASIPASDLVTAGTAQITALNPGSSESNALSFSITASQIYSLTASPTSVSPGGSVTVTWGAPAGSSTTDWVGMFKAGASDSAYIAWKYTGGTASGSTTMTAPTGGGQYEFRYFLNNGFSRGAVSNQFSVTVGYSLTASPAAVSAGANTTVSWLAGTDRTTTDWVGLYKVGTADSAYLWWRFTDGTASGNRSVPMPSTAGQYEFRYFRQAGYVRLATSNVVEVSSAPTFTLEASPTSIMMGESVTLTYTAGSDRSATDWIGLFKVGTSDNSYTWWQYTGGNERGSFSVPIPTDGQYEFRYFRQNGFTKAATSNTVTVNRPAYSLTASPSTVARGGQVTVTWTAPAGTSARDWVGLYRVGDPSNTYGSWFYTNGQSSGSRIITMPSTAGQYEFRYMLDNGFTERAKSNSITVN